MPEQQPRQSVIVERLDSLLAYTRARDLGEGKNISTWLSGVHTPNTDRSIGTTTTIVNNAGTFTSLQLVIVSGTIARNLYVQVTLQDNSGNRKGILFRGYVETGKQPFGTGGLVVNQGDLIRLDSWGSVTCTVRLTGMLIRDRQIPGGWTGTNEGPLEGQGRIVIAQIAQPASATDTAVSVPTGARWRLRSFSFNFTTSNTVANRRVVLRYNASAVGNYLLMPAAVNQTASQNNIQYHFASPSVSDTSILDAYVRVPVADLVVGAGQSIGTSIYNLNMGDQVSAATYQVEEWIEP